MTRLERTLCNVNKACTYIVILGPFSNFVVAASAFQLKIFVFNFCIGTLYRAGIKRLEVEKVNIKEIEFTPLLKMES